MISFTITKQLIITDIHSISATVIIMTIIVSIQYRINETNQFEAIDYGKC